MAASVIAIVVYGFSFTIQENLIHPSYSRPWILYVHAAVFSAWLFVFGLQTALVWSRRVALHRRLGAYGLAFGAAIPPLGVARDLIVLRDVHPVYRYALPALVAGQLLTAYVHRLPW